MCHAIFEKQMRCLNIRSLVLLLPIIISNIVFLAQFKTTAKDLKGYAMKNCVIGALACPVRHLFYLFKLPKAIHTEANKDFEEILNSY